MDIINIKDLDLNNSFFHFSKRDNLEQIEKEGLKAKIGDASKIKSEKEARVYLSKGGKGIIGIKNSFIHEIKKLKICDLPKEYRQYFDFLDFSSTEQVKENDVYNAMEKRFKDEMYFLVDAKEGEDYIIEDFYPEELINSFRGSNNERDVKGKKNHDIEPSKIKLICSDNGNTAFDIVEYLYNRLLENAKKDGKEEIVKSKNSDLNEFFEYIKNKQKNAFKESLKVEVNKSKENTEKNQDTIVDLGERE